MKFDDYIIKGYELFGPEAMQIAIKFFSGEIDFETCVDDMMQSVAHYHMNEEIHEKTPSKIKITSQFYAYLGAYYTDNVVHTENDDSARGYVSKFAGIPIEIDNTIDSDCYELVY